jgi:hypothetical protein
MVPFHERKESYHESARQQTMRTAATSSWLAWKNLTDFFCWRAHLNGVYSRYALTTEQSGHDNGQVFTTKKTALPVMMLLPTITSCIDQESAPATSYKTSARAMREVDSRTMVSLGSDHECGFNQRQSVGNTVGESTMYRTKISILCCETGTRISCSRFYFRQSKNITGRSAVASEYR